MNCLTCNYDRAGIDNDKPCPECGAPAPKHHRIARDRYVVLILLRLVVVCGGLWVLYLLLANIVGIFQSDYWGYFTLGDALTYLSFILVPAVLTFVLWCLAGQLAKWIVPTRSAPPSQMQEIIGPAWFARASTVSTIVLYLIGLTAGLVSLQRLVLTAFYAIQARHATDRAGFAVAHGAPDFRLGDYLAWALSPLSITLVTMLFAPTLVRFIVPNTLFTRCLSCGVAFDKNNPPDTCPDCGWVVRKPGAHSEQPAAKEAE